MHPIHIPDLLRKHEATAEIEFEEVLLDLETLMPIKGVIRLVHQGTYLDVSAQVTTIVTLTCDRCLQQYNHRISITPQEPIWLDEQIGLEDFEEEREVSMEDLVESIDPHGDFDIDEWIYQQLCLALPHPKHCRPDCPGVEVDPTIIGGVDSRWAALQKLQGQLPSET
ncbi:MAG: DUF177 domain-containing protein [Oscillatoriales cyanobacterium]|nr:MAG: DUF177 domain-containing protein [Oscillatoriales cyanobacterium]